MSDGFTRKEKRDIVAVANAMLDDKRKDDEERGNITFGIELPRLRELAEAERNHEAIIPKLDCKTCHWRKDQWKCNSCYGTLTPENYSNWYELDDEIKWQREQDALAAADAGKGEKSDG